MNLPPRSRHLPARVPSSWMYFVVRMLPPLRGLRPSSRGAGTVSVRVALSRAARVPLLTFVRFRLLGVAKLRRGDTSRAIVESRRGVRARVTVLGLFSRPESDAIGLVRGPTPTASAASVDASRARVWPPARRTSTSQSSCVS